MIKKVILSLILLFGIEVYIYAQDTTPPCAVSNLTALTDTAKEGGILLKWTAPGDDGTVGTAYKYILKYATSQITSSDFYALWTSTYTQDWTPVEAGSAEGPKQVLGFDPGTTYYFALVAEDTSTNRGSWSTSGVNQDNFAVAYDTHPAAPDALKVDGQTEPGVGTNKNGVENPNPEFSWNPDPVAGQSAYRIVVADNENDLNEPLSPNIWDSGKVSTTSSFCIYAGTPTLKTNTTYYFKVRCWDISSDTSPYSAVSSFKMNHFVKKQELGITPSQTAFSVGDIDNDGYRDFVQANIDKKYITAYRYDSQSGTFAYHWRSSTATCPVKSQSIALSDLDNDGDLDIIVLNTSASGVDNNTRIFFNDGAGNFPSTYLISSNQKSYSYSIAVGDIDRDGDMDFVEGNYGPENCIYINDGQGSFTVDVMQNQTDTQDLILADFNKDGYLDLLEGNRGESNNLYLNDGSGSISSTPSWSSTETENTRALTLLDINKDGFWDFVAGNDIEDRFYINDGDGSFNSAGITEEPDNTYSLTSGDIDNDGDIDYVCGTHSPNDRIYKNIKGSMELIYDFFSQNISSYKMNLNDMTGDGHLDLLRGLYSTDKKDQYMITHSSFVNSGPQAPESLQAEFVEDQGRYKVSWEPPSGASNQVSYNIRFGTSSGNYNVTSGALGSTDNSGSFWGNVGRSTYVWLNLDPKSYYWQVQAIDESKVPGDWSAEMIINEPPVSGWSEDFVLPSTCAVQWTMYGSGDSSVVDSSGVFRNERRGMVDIFFKVKDREKNYCWLTDFGYSTSASGPWINLSDTSTALTQENKTSLNEELVNLWPDNRGSYFDTVNSTAPYSQAQKYRFIWDTDDISRLQDSEFDNLRIRYKVVDRNGVESVKYSSTNVFGIDNKSPSQPGMLKSEGQIYGSSFYNLSFGTISSDTNFKEYKIYYATFSGVNKDNYYKVWDSTDDSCLLYYDYSGKSSTTITSLSPDTTYYFNIYAYDNYGNFSSTNTVSAKTNDQPDLSIFSTSQRTDGSDLVDIVFGGIDNDVEVSSYVWSGCLYRKKITGDDYIMTPSTDDIEFTNQPINLGKSIKYSTFVWNAGLDVPNISSDTFGVSIRLTDGKDEGTTGFTKFTVDTKPPVPDRFWVENFGSNSITWQWDSAIEDNFSGYELWYTSVAPGGYAVEKDTDYAKVIKMPSDDPTVNLSTSAFNLDSSKKYWACLWIYDKYGHEVHTSTRCATTGYPPSINISRQPVPLKDGSGKVEMKIDIFDLDKNPCDLKVNYSIQDTTYTAYVEVSTLTFGSVTVDNTTDTYRITGVETEYNSKPSTNTVTIRWLSKQDFPGAYKENIDLQVIAFDGYVKSEVIISTFGFTIDNSRPDPKTVNYSTSSYSHSDSLFTLWIKGESPDENYEIFDTTKTVLSRFIVFDDYSNPVSSITLSGSQVTASPNFLYIEVSQEIKNQIARWDGQGNTPFLRILSSATADSYGNYSVKRDTIVFDSFPDGIRWDEDTIKPELNDAFYKVSEQGDINLDIQFNEFMDVPFLAPGSMEQIKIEDSSDSGSYVNLNSSCTVLTREDDSENINIKITDDIHKEIWRWNADRIILVLSKGVVRDLSAKEINKSSVPVNVEVSTESPHVISVFPLRDSYNINISTHIKVKFDEPLFEDEAARSITVRQVFDSGGDRVDSPISGQTTYETINKQGVLTFVPEQGLPGNSLISVDIDRSGIISMAKVYMEQDFSWEFKTDLKKTDPNLIVSPSGNVSVYIPSGYFPSNGRVEFTENIPPNTPKESSINSVHTANNAENCWENPFHYTFDNMTSEIIFYNNSDRSESLCFDDDAQITLNYSDNLINSDSEYLTYGSKPPVKEETLKIYYLHEDTGKWIPLESEVDIDNNTVSADLRHFSIYTLMGSPTYDVENAHPYPVPYKPSERPEIFNNTIRAGITFTGLPSQCNIEIYTITGRLVKSLHHSDEHLSAAGQPGNFYWYPVKNEYDELIASGLYIYFIKSESSSKSGKLMIIR